MRAIMLAILCLCACAAVGEDADTAFCDTIDGAIAELRKFGHYSASADLNHSLGTDYYVSRVMQPTKLPGAADCTAYVYGDPETAFYTCRWTSGSPRSTFVDLERD